jgi:hypothetical protein
MAFARERKETVEMRIGRVGRSARWVGVSIIWLAILGVTLSGCGNLTVGPVTFDAQRTPRQVITVGNTDPVPFAARSQNWAGYFVREYDATAVSATWQVPRVTGPANSDSSTWIGIGGVKNNSLIQAGTDQLLQKGKSYYYAWYELLPALPQPFNHIDLLPGDIVTFTIIATGPQSWNITVVDHDANEHQTQVVTYPSCRCSAEWIEEAPTIQQQQVTLADFTSVTFQSISTTRRGKTFTPAWLCPPQAPPSAHCVTPVRMVDPRGVPMVEPQVLHNGSFSLVYIYSQPGG